MTGSSLILSKQTRKRLAEERMREQVLRRTMLVARREALLAQPTHDGTLTIEIASGMSGQAPSVAFQIKGVDATDEYIDIHGYDPATKSLVTARISCPTLTLTEVREPSADETAKEDDHAPE